MLNFNLKLFSHLVKNFSSFLFAGGIHWSLSEKTNLDYKYYAKWPTENNSKFLFKNQVKDNMF